MKKITLLAVLFAASFSVKAQVLDTSVTSIAACKIVPFKANFTDTSNACYLGIRSVGDDLKSSCQLYYCFLDANKNIVMQGNVTIAGADYEAWDGNNKYPFTFLGTYFKIVFVKP
jgi:hypothetical protein